MSEELDDVEAAEPEGAEQTGPAPGWLEEMSSEAERFAIDVGSLIAEVESIGVLNPIAAYSRIRRARLRRAAMRDSAQLLSSRGLKVLNARLSGPIWAYTPARLYIMGEGLTVFLQTSHQWHTLGAMLDRKESFALANAALYIAIISLIITVALGVAAL